MNSPSKDRLAWLQGPSAECQEIAAAQYPWRLILLGAPGVGKGTQADLLHASLRACHLSTGDVFRYSGSLKKCEQSQAMQAAQAYMQRGELVPDLTVWEMVQERVACLRCGGGFILDGFPRTLVQAVSLKDLLEREQLSVSAVVNYELSIEEIVSRLSGRRTCPGCKAVFHVSERPPKVGGRCDHCGTALFQREDDRPESIKIRMEAYARSTAPLIDFYSKLDLLLPIRAKGSPEDICATTVAALEGRRAATVSRG
jgi:adenylate kinase